MHFRIVIGLFWMLTEIWQTFEPYKMFSSIVINQLVGTNNAEILTKNYFPW